jgi:hypothetical protein
MSVDEVGLLPPSDSSPIVTIHVRHPEYSQPIPADFQVPREEVQRRLHATLRSQVGRTLSKILEMDFDLDSPALEPH